MRTLSLVLLSLLLACGDKETAADRKMDKAGEELKKATQDASDGLKDLTHDAGQAIQRDAKDVGAVIQNGAATAGDAIDDAALTAAVKAALVKDKDLSALTIGVSVESGVVTLTGRVENTDFGTAGSQTRG